MCEATFLEAGDRVRFHHEPFVRRRCEGYGVVRKIEWQDESLAMAVIARDEKDAGDGILIRRLLQPECIYVRKTLQ